MDPAENKLPRYQNSPVRLEYERERSSIDITEAQVQSSSLSSFPTFLIILQYKRMLAKSDGTPEGNVLKATAFTNGIFGFEQNYQKALH
jgi:hypothetical protein